MLLGFATAVREKDRRTESYRLRIFAELVQAYNGIKAVRRRFVPWDSAQSARVIVRASRGIEDWRARGIVGRCECAAAQQNAPVG